MSDKKAQNCTIEVKSVITVWQIPALCVEIYFLITQSAVWVVHLVNENRKWGLTELLPKATARKFPLGNALASDWALAHVQQALARSICTPAVPISYLVIFLCHFMTRDAQILEGCGFTAPTNILSE